MRLIFRPQARGEVLQAQAWYEERSPGLGLEFARAVDVAIAQVLRMPLAFPRIEAEFRHVVMRRFPYSLIYHPSGPELVVVSCFHHRRQPGAWARNLSD
ncbi:MAG: type II toxin-antitoxin system RelE/ParE family toxin [Methylibium sp.]|uniref:type II toxin-antitoxin system RelE/ParE family toxin n=1 Tax=Methylibium sp. TaxID=2067992 RepID=UPI0017BCFFA3|nr:type II toxin-antitoxin system RelE/ParE family toxin [Methylibium sp.]MBA3589521.1 type II toxin-antitoxin system RelE/ParE family toxin [Methylibium sp.]MBA3623567.1 type II toxin-antitoxin system RelE/ParE family toxin [Methylibium sp.]